MINDYFLINNICTTEDISLMEYYSDLDSEFPLCTNNKQKLGYNSSLLVRSGQDKYTNL